MVSRPYGLVLAASVGIGIAACSSAARPPQRVIPQAAIIAPPDPGLTDCPWPTAARPGRPLTHSSLNVELNTETLERATFLKNLKEQIFARWHPEADFRARDPSAARFGHRDRYTELCIRIANDGHVADALVHTSSGLDFLDAEATDALRAAQPFLAPPPSEGLPDGSVVFRFGFLFVVQDPASACAPSADEPAMRSLGNRPMLALCADVYADPATPREAWQPLRESVSRAAQRNVDIYGPLLSPNPTIIFCHTDDCRRYFAGPSMRSGSLDPGRSASGARFVAARPTIIVARTDWRAVNHLAYGWSDVELGIRARWAFVPAWFREGAAAFVSDEPWCIGTKVSVADNLHDFDLPGEWVSATNSPNPDQNLAVRCEARRAVTAWFGARGPGALPSLIDRIRVGVGFYDVYDAGR
jgi:TonB family protein